MHFEYKIWLEIGNKAVFGIGLFQLLSLVKQTGSLHKAAQKLKMSYRAAWGKIRTSEEILGVELLEKGRHGRNGAHLTEKGSFIIEKFGKAIHEMDEIVTAGPLAKCVGEIKQIKHKS
jgi:molybdate transport system regulatory protein